MYRHSISIVRHREVASCRRTRFSSCAGCPTRSRNDQPGACRVPPAANEIRDESESLLVTVTRQPDLSAVTACDDLVRKLPGSDVGQLSAWANVRRTAGFEPLYVFVRRGRDLVGGALAMGRRLPLVGEVGYVPYGPVISTDADRDAVAAELAAALRRLTRRTMRMLFVQP